MMASDIFGEYMSVFHFVSCRHKKDSPMAACLCLMLVCSYGAI